MFAGSSTKYSLVFKIARIRDEYRNPSAHAQEVTVVDAQECIGYVLTVRKKLAELLEQYRN